MVTMQKRYWTTKTEDLNFEREDFAQRGKKKRPLVANLKKKFNPLAKSDKKTLSLIEQIEEIVPNSILFNAVPKPKIDIFGEIITD